MSRCGNCGGSSGGCTCSFMSNSTAVYSGNGRSYAASNFRPVNVPTPRPFGLLTRRNSDQAVAAASFEAITFDTEFNVFSGGMANIALSTSRLTAPVSGYYLFGAYIMSSNVNATILIRKNGDQAQIREIQTGAAAGEITAMNLMELAAADYVEVMISTAAGAAATIVRTDVTSYGLTQDCYPQFWGEWVRAL